MMQKILYWLRTEYQRAADMLPLLLLRSVMIALVIGILFSGLTAFLGKKQEKEQAVIQVGYVAKEDMLMNLLESYVKEMEAFDGWCELLKVTEEEGKELLQEGKLEALLVLPENLVEEIITGTNAPAKLFLPEQSSAMGIVFEELADAGIQMLTVAQGEIYAVYELAESLGLGKEQLLSFAEEINYYNMGLVMGREDLFREKKVSLTNNEGIAVYYMSAFFSIYLLVSGCLFGPYIRRSQQEQLLMWKRLGFSIEIQLLGRMLITAMLLIVSMLPMVGLWLLPELRSVFMPSFTWQGVVLILLSVICVAAYIQLLYQLSEQHRVAVVMVGLLAVVQGYIAGCLIPSVLLPQIVKRISACMPATYIRQSFSMLFTGSTQDTGSICIGLILILLFLTVVNIAVMYKRTQAHAIGGMSEPVLKKTRAGRISGTLCGIYAKRLLYRKSFWCSLCLIMLVSVLLVRMESQSETTLYAAFYDESGAWEETLCTYKGYIQFLSCDSQEEVRQLVLRNEAECGYVIPEDFKEQIQKQNANRSIQVYEDADAIMTETINEILFGKLFEVLSKEWLAEYLNEWDSLFTALEQKMTDGSTFMIEKEYLQTNMSQSTTSRGGRTTYPIIVVIFMAVLLCGLTGVMEALEDYRKYRFFKRKPIGIIVINVIQPVICGVVMGLSVYAFFIMNIN